MVETIKVTVHWLDGTQEDFHPDVNADDDPKLDWNMDFRCLTIQECDGPEKERTMIRETSINLRATKKVVVHYA
jgi:hypothetical protein